MSSKERRQKQKPNRMEQALVICYKYIFNVPMSSKCDTVLGLIKIYMHSRRN